MQTSIYIDRLGKKWYYKLLKKDEEPKAKALFEDVSMETIQEQLLICLQKEVRLFSLFASHVELFDCQARLPQQHRCFYEVIRGESPQKPHFDIEYMRDEAPDLQPDIVKDQVVTAIRHSFEEKGVDLQLDKHLLLFDSSNTVKCSFHIIIDHYCHTSHREAKAFYLDVIKRLPTEIRRCVDGAVYSRLQQFRIVGSQKWQTTRTKVFKPIWDYQGTLIHYNYNEPPLNDKHRCLLELEASLISRTHYCQFLPSFLMEEERKQYNETPGELKKEEVDKSLQLLSEFGQVSLDDERFPYRYSHHEGPFILLKRIRPSRCPLCKRIHEHENPYLVIHENKVYFNCRRAPEKSRLYLGSLTPALPPLPSVAFDSKVLMSRLLKLSQGK